MVNKLLSICIPTYNRADKLKMCLDCVFKAVDLRDDVEIIVSDNCSTDETNSVIMKYSKMSNFHSYRNNTNLGFNGNMSLLIDNYAHGHYCWIIGDDDLLDSDAINLIYPILKSKKHPFISIGHRCLFEEDYKSFILLNNRVADYFIGRFFQCVDKNSSSSNILGTFMSSQIFELSTIKSFDKSTFPMNTWNDFKSVFPNSYMMTNSFYNRKDCCSIATPIITALSYNKDWDDKLNKLITEILPSYFDYCEKLSCNNKSDLHNNKYIIQKGILSVQLSEIGKSKSIINKLHLLNPKYFGIYLMFLKMGILSFLNKYKIYS